MEQQPPELRVVKPKRRRMTPAERAISHLDERRRAAMPSGQPSTFQRFDWRARVVQDRVIG